MKYNWFYLKKLQVQDWINSQKLKVYNKVKTYVFNKELDQFTSRVNYDEYGAVKLIKSNPNYWVFNPVEAVTYVIKTHFNEYTSRCFRLGIFGIDIDTQDETIDVTIRLKRPGLLIGKSGNDITELQNKLSKVFNMPTKIHIEEVKKDNNEPYICY